MRIVLSLILLSGVALAEDAMTLREAADAGTLPAPNSAEETASRLRSGRLLSLGVTGGAALAVITPMFEDGSPTVNNATTATVSPAPMPYLALLPAYWGYREAARTYCASSWGGGSEKDAYISANAVSRDAAELVLAAIETFPHDVSVEDLKKRLRLELEGDLGQRILGEPGHENDQLVGEIHRYLQKPDLEVRKRLVARIALLDWDPSRPALCWISKFGVWLGVPAAHEVRAKVQGVNANQTYRPVVAFGITFVPNAYVSVLLGAVFGNFMIGETTDTKGTPQPAWGLVIGLGGNLDILPALAALGAGK